MKDSLLPRNNEVEQGLLGALIQNYSIIHDCMVELLPEMFYDDKHQIIFKAIKQLYDLNVTVDIISINNQLKKTNYLQSAGGTVYLTQLMGKVTGATGSDYHLKLLKQEWAKRRIIDISGKLQASSYDPTFDTFDLLETASNEFDKVSENLVSAKDIQSFSDRCTDAIKRAEIRERKFKNNEISGITTGFKELDEVTNGWQKTDLIILAGRPGMGKTAQVLHHVKTASKANKTVLVFSLEMSAEQLTDRLILSEANIEPFRFKSGGISASEWEPLTENISSLSDLNILIDDKPGVNLNYIKSVSRIKKRKNNIDLIVIDYLQLMDGAKDQKGNREQEISTISRGLKGLAKELDIPVIALSQLSRANEIRGGDKRPILSDLRESGAIEQDADMVLFIYRPEYYKLMQYDNGVSTEKIAEIIIAKNRHGALREIKVKHDGTCHKFYDIDSVTNINYSEFKPLQDYTQPLEPLPTSDLF